MTRLLQSLALLATLAAGFYAASCYGERRGRARERVRTVDSLVADFQITLAVGRARDSALRDSLANVLAREARYRRRMVTFEAALDSAAGRNDSLTRALLAAGSDTSLVLAFGALVDSLAQGFNACRATLGVCDSAAAMLRGQVDDLEDRVLRADSLLMLSRDALAVVRPPSRTTPLLLGAVGGALLLRLAQLLLRP